MNARQRHIASLTRNRDFIIRAAAAIGLLFFALGSLFHFLNRGHETPAATPAKLDSARDIAAGIRHLGDGWQTLHALLPGAAPPTSLPQLEKAIDEAGLEAQAAQLLSRFLTALTSGRDQIEPSRDHFETLHRENPAQPLAAGFAAYLNVLAGNPGRALPLYVAEGKHRDASFERAAAFTIAVELEDRRTLVDLLEKPEFVDDLPARHRDAVAIITGDFAGLMANQFAAWYRHLEWPHLAVALLTGSIWFVIVFQTVGLTRSDLPLALSAVAAGVLSTAVTLALDAVQEFYTDVELTGAILDDAVYWFAGVGLREEFSKLACFALLLPFLRRAASAPLAFACASYVGLGFAIEENTLYFVQSDSASALGRFLTANFLHLSTTGIAGYYLYRLAFGFRGRWEPALGAFLFVVFLHGAYDFLPSTPFVISREIGIASVFIIGILAFTHAKMSEEVHSPVRQVVSPLAVFVLGTATVVGLSFAVFASQNAGAGSFVQSVSTFGKASVSIITIAFLFINRFRSA